MGASGQFSSYRLFFEDLKAGIHLCENSINKKTKCLGLHNGPVEKCAECGGPVTRPRLSSYIQTESDVSFPEAETQFLLHDQELEDSVACIFESLPNGERGRYVGYEHITGAEKVHNLEQEDTLFYLELLRAAVRGSNSGSASGMSFKINSRK